MSNFEFQKYHLEIVSGFCLNVSAFWFVALLGSKNVVVLLVDIAWCIVYLYLAMQALKFSKDYD